MGITTNYKTPDGTDIGTKLVEKAYLLDRYPELADTFKYAGLWLWGVNLFGSIGDNTTVYKSSPVQTVAGGTNWKYVSSDYTMAGIKSNGTLWLWGSNSYGAVGDNTVTQRNSPVQTVAGGTNWKQVSTGGSTAWALKTDGTLWTWGGNSSGVLGDNTTTNKSSPVQTIAGGTNWKFINTEVGSPMAIKNDGTLWVWGSNTDGKLGTNNTTNYSSPVQTVAGGTNWKFIASDASTVGIKTDGTLWTWGRNSFGQLGDNTIVNKSSPVQTVAGGTNWKQASTWGNMVGAVKTDGTLWIWGYNASGQLGDNTVAPRSSPIQTVAGGTNWKSINIGNQCSGGIKTNGTLWTWGLNSDGRLGDNTVTQKSSPVQTVAGGTNWKLLSIGSLSGAIRDDSEDLL